jgi:hypothetical protein
VFTPVLYVAITAVFERLSRLRLVPHRT